MDAPHISEIIENYTTAAAIILGGGWALWKWGFEEARRRRREIPSLDGKLSTVTTDLNEGKCLVTLEATWRNPGVLPVRLNTQQTCVNVYDLNNDVELGHLKAIDDLVSIYSSCPLNDLEDYILEPSTNSTMQEHFIFDKAKVYLVRWELFQRPDEQSSPAFSWVRDIVWQYSRGDITQATHGLAQKLTEPITD